MCYLYTIPEQNLVVVEGIDPSSRAYEARAHPSTPHNLMLGYSMEFESMLTESQSVVLTADTNYTILKHTLPSIISSRLAGTALYTI